MQSEKKQVPTTDDILTMAGTTLSELCIQSHRPNYVHLLVRILDGDIIEAKTYESTDTYYPGRSAEWHSIVHVGTGSCPCNCDSCQDGDNPDCWADDGETMLAMEDEIINGLANEV